jgi:hypothetical protein
MHANEEDLYIVYEESVFYQYWISCYMSVLLVTGNDVAPRSTF